jgi:DNA repair and recombination protein RAD54B
MLIICFRLTEGKLPIARIDIGEQFHIGNKDVEVDHPIDRANYMAGTCFGTNPYGGPSAPMVLSTSSSAISALRKPYKALKPSLASNASALRSGVVTSNECSSASNTRGSRIELEAVNLASSSVHRERKVAEGGNNSYWSASW